MAIRVTPARGMNGLSQKNFENATKYEVKDTSHGLVLDIYEGNKRVSTYAPGCWESVDFYTPLDQKKGGKNKLDVPQAAIEGLKTKTKKGDEIRTSPRKSGGRVKGHKR